MGVDSLILITGESGVERRYVPVSGATTTTHGTIQDHGRTATYQSESQTTMHGGYFVNLPWAKVTTHVIDLQTGRSAWVSASETGGNGMASFDHVRNSYCKAVAERIVKDRLFTLGEWTVAPLVPSTSAVASPGPTPGETVPQEYNPEAAAPTLEKAQAVSVTLEPGLTRDEVFSLLGRPTTSEHRPSTSKDGSTSTMLLVWNYEWPMDVELQRPPKVFVLFFTKTDDWRLVSWQWF